jgi:hypothetical protein
MRPLQVSVRERTPTTVLAGEAATGMKRKDNINQMDSGDGTGSLACPMVCLGISSFQSSGAVTRAQVSHNSE